MGGKTWTEQEDRLIEKPYEHSTETELLLLLPSRTYSSIKQRANGTKNIKKKCLNKFIDHDTHTVMLVESTKGQVFEVLLDKEDVPKVKGHHSSWVAMRNRDGVFYIGDTNSYKLHRLIMNAPSGLVVDHIEHNPLDNRKEKLRVVTVAENNRNRKPRQVID